MDSRRRFGFSSRKPLPTISESPTGTQPSGSPTSTHSFGTASAASYSSAFGKSSSTFQKPNRLSGTNGPGLLPPLKSANIKPRTSKTSQKHVALPTTAQDVPLPSTLEALDMSVPPNAEDLLGDGEGLSSEESPEEPSDSRTRRRRKIGERENIGVRIDDAAWTRTIGEQLTPEQRDEDGYQRLTAYYCCEEFETGLLTTFLKREHAVLPRLYDDAIYALYHLPLLPGYQPGVNVRSCITDKAAQAKLALSLITEAEESGYRDAYFPASGIGSTGSGSGASTPVGRDGFIETAFPADTNLGTLLANKALRRANTSHGKNGALLHPVPTPSPRAKRRLLRTHITQRRLLGVEEHPVAEAIFFQYGVAIFFGFSQRNELDILDDLLKRGIIIGEKKVSDKQQYETESFHFEYDPSAPTPRIYNDFFTFKSPSHLLKLAIAHAIAQSTVLATHETAVSKLLSSPNTMSIPLQLATDGIIKMRRRAALRLTGQLFQMRQNVNLSSNVLDVPELFWSEASLKGLYDAVREYLEVNRRVKVLNEKLASVGELLDVIHDHLNTDAMERITLIIIWLIVVACLVELGELLARWVLAASAESRLQAQILANREAVLRILDTAGA